MVTTNYRKKEVLSQHHKSSYFENYDIKYFSFNYLNGLFLFT